MDFVGITLGALIMLGIVAAIATWGSTDDPIVKADDDCAGCTGRDDCKLAAMKESRKIKNNSSEQPLRCNKMGEKEFKKE